METKRKLRAREAKLGFEALSIEGGLLSPEWLAKVAQARAGGQSEADYRVPRGLNLRDEIGRFWRIAQAHWADFQSASGARADPVSTGERFVVALLREVFGFSTLARRGVVTVADRSYPIGFATPGGRVPVVVAAAGSGLDTLSPSFGDGGRRRSAFGLAQEYLNADDGALWGIATDGRALRIVRDNVSLTRPAFLEADLERIFTETRYADFTALWLLCHATRFGRDDQPVADCALEAWRNAGREEGVRAREHLRRGVEEALEALGRGFLEHADNHALRAALQSGQLPKHDYFNQLLRLVYRMIFLLTAEERGLLHPEATTDAARALYEGGYGFRQLCERSAKRRALDRFSDLWERIKIVFRGVACGEPRLGLPALGGIFARGRCPALDAARLENGSLLRAVFKLAWLRDEGTLSRVNWRDMGPEELGSVYESLLELVPQIAVERRQFSFAKGGEAKGNARKTTGSYYTPDSLVQALLDSALEPVIADTIAGNPGKEVEALLGLKIVDPACGSGHFLLGAARRLAAHVARLQVNGTPSASEYRHALREVVGGCIFGVDLNPLAVELCRVALWMEAVEPGKPLTFLDSHIQQGNSLIGTTPALMENGVPDAAWDPLEGDDRKIAAALKKRNRKAAAGQRSLDTLWSPADAEARAVTRAVVELDAASDGDLGALVEKEERWGGILDSPDYRHQKFVADAWCAAFVWPMQPGPLAEAAPTNELWRQLRDKQGRPPELTVKEVEKLAKQYHFFHWHLQFAQVFAKGGFDVVLGNPPWERVKLQEQEFFATRDSTIADAPTAAARKKLIDLLVKADPILHADFLAARRLAEGQSHFLRNSTKYPLTGTGDVNTYAVFAECNRQLLTGQGRMGLILPTGIATDATTAAFFRDLVEKRALISLYDFENAAGLFRAIHRSFKFCLLTIASQGRSGAGDFAFFLHEPSALRGSNVRFSLTAEEIRLLNPNTGTCPVFRSRRDAEITLGIYRQLPILVDENDSRNGNPWHLKLSVMFHMSNDSRLFKTRDELEQGGWTLNGNVFELPCHSGKIERMLPLFEGKMIHHYDTRWATFDYGGMIRNVVPEEKFQGFLAIPRFWVLEEEVRQRLQRIEAKA